MRTRRQLRGLGLGAMWFWAICFGVCNARCVAGDLIEQAYVWQRAWTPAVRDAVQSHGGAFSELALLAGEIAWKNSKPVTTRVALPYDLLRASKAPIGLALRIGPFAGPFSESDETAANIASAARSMVNEARTNGVTIREVQIDFDCADLKLGGYARWVRAIKRAAGPVPVAITALPTWLDQSAFGALAAAADGYVLQVHSLQRPKSYDAPFTLCDPALARAAVLKAGGIGVPFRVALPTYGYLLAFAPDGRFVGLSAEGPAKSWPANARLREVRSEPAELARLVREWTAQRPAAMGGIIWYRLPTVDDNLNLRWQTLDAIIRARSLREVSRAQTRRVEAGLYEISLVNDGELDVSSRLAVDVHWQRARLRAGDGLRGFELVEVNSSTAKFQSKALVRLRAGDTWTIGWIRLNQDAEVKLEINND